MATSSVCLGQTTKHQPCTRLASQKVGDEPLYCWQHQKMRTASGPVDPESQMQMQPLISIKSDHNHLWVQGDTFPLRIDLNRLHGSWDPIQSHWILPTEQSEALTQLANIHNYRICISAPTDAPPVVDKEDEIKPSHVIKLFFDGASKGNPGPAGCGFHVFAENFNLNYQQSDFLGTNTNNVAEYQGLIHGLQYISQWLQHNPITPRLIIHGDSQLVIRQMLGTYQIKQPALQQLHTTAEQLMTHLREQHLVTEMELIHIVRKHNAIADHLASTAAFSGHGEVVDTVG